jgi:hypothetical protein
LPSATGAENVTERVVFVATFCAPAGGVEDVTLNVTSDARDDAAPLDEERFEAAACPLCDGAEWPAKITKETTMSTMAAAARKSGRSRPRDRAFRDSTTPSMAASA